MQDAAARETPGHGVVCAQSSTRNLNATWRMTLCEQAVIAV